MTDVPVRCDRRAPALASLLALLLGCMRWADGAEPSAVPAPAWENVSASFTAGLGTLQPEFLNRCQGLIVTPTGDLVMQTASLGICISRDQGATWTAVEGNGISGRCEHSSAFSIAYPYDGRMAFFAYDGRKGQSGGISLDGGRTWKPFAQVSRGVEYGDVDWSAPDGRTIIAVTHEPWFAILSEDAGASWRRLDPLDRGAGVTCQVGLVDATRLVRFDLRSGSMDLSEDGGVAWNPVAHYQVLGRRPVHFGRRLFWATARGVITSTDGTEWALTGKGAEGARHGPYFGASDQEFVVVTDKAFLRTTDGGASWKRIADLYVAPDLFRGNAGYAYYGWDAAHGILYASGLGGSVWRLRVPAAP